MAGLQQKTSCESCAWVQWGYSGKKKMQIGCCVKQLDRVKHLKEKVDPNGHDIDNSLFKVSEFGDKAVYVLNMLCPFIRTAEWAEDNLPETLYDAIQLPPSEEHKEQLREFVFKHIPFMYHAIVMYDGKLKGTLKAVKSIMNGTVPPVSLSVVIPSKYKNYKEQIEELILAMRDRIGKDINRPEFTYTDSVTGLPIHFTWEVRPMMVDEVDDTTKLRVEEAVKNKPGSFYILVLNGDSRLTEEFIESIKGKVHNTFLDFHIIFLSSDEALIAHPVFDGTHGLVPACIYVCKNDGKELMPEVKPDWLRNFFSVVEDKQ